MATPGTDDFCAFVEAFFGDRIDAIDDRAKSGHIVYHIPDHPRNIAVPKGRDHLRELTFAELLHDMGIDRAEFRELAGTPAKLKAYCKRQKREAGE